MVVADLHDSSGYSHLCSLSHSILLSNFHECQKEVGNWKVEIGNFILIGFLLSCMYMTNAWMEIIYFLLTGLVFLYLYWEKLPAYKKTLEVKNQFKFPIPRFMSFGDKILFFLYLLFFSAWCPWRFLKFYFKPFASELAFSKCRHFSSAHLRRLPI